ncbi:MAG: hypothetical protein GY847_22530 [Proteobacteria bacterium]|nr:hypothetical protein [Pseudomonadota bacterium]
MMSAGAFIQRGRLRVLLRQVFNVRSRFRFPPLKKGDRGISSPKRNSEKDKIPPAPFFKGESLTRENPFNELLVILFFILVVLPSGAQAADSGIPDAGKATDAGLPIPEVPIVSELPADRMPELKLSCEPKEVNIGEVINWQLTVKHRVGDRVHLASGASFGTLEVRSKEVVQGVASGEWIDDILKVQLIGFEPGEVAIPPQKLTVVDVNGSIGEVETEPATVTVKSLVANEPEPKIKEDQGGGVRVFEKDYTLLWVLGILGGAAAIVLLTLLGRWLWAKRSPRPGPPPPPPRPAEDIALEKLDALRLSTLLAQGQIKEFHVRLSETIREYLGNRYRFDSLELSTEELIRTLRESTIGRVDIEYTVEFLQETDLVKFAKMIPTLDESYRLLEKSFEFVKKTTPSPLISSNDAASATESEKGGASDA